MAGAGSAGGPSLVIQLQAAALEDGASVTSILLKAKLVAAKLGLRDDELALWIEDELNGYVESPRDLPPYRVISVIPVAHNPFRGEIPVQIGPMPDPRLYKALHELPLTQSIGEIEELASRDSSNLRAEFPPALRDIVHGLADASFPLRWKFGPSQLRGVLDAVRQRALTWALELEGGGVLGEGFTFSLKEKAAAVTITNNFTNSNIANAGQVAAGGTVNAVQSVTANGLDVPAVLALIAQIKQNLSALPNDIQSVVQDEVARIESEAKKPSPSDSVIKNALLSLKATCEGAAGNLIASGILSNIGGIIGG